MPFEPLSFLRFGDPPFKTSTYNRTTIKFPDSDDREFKIEYYSIPPEEYSFLQVWPAPGSAKASSSLWLPPPHYHLVQDEHFRVDSGVGIWHLYGKSVKVRTGETICVKARSWHWFEPDPECTEQFAVLYRYDREYPELEESFFRNQFGYMQDCRSQGKEWSIIQAMVFAMHNWMPFALPEHRWIPESVNFVLSLIILVVIGSVGEFLMGYRKSYSEYYRAGEKEN